MNYELEAELERRGKLELLQVLRDIAPPQLKVTAVRQGRALGLGHAVYCARPVVGDAPFAVLLPDVLVEQQAADNDLKLMTQRFIETGGHSQIMVEPVPEELVSQYGVVDVQGVDLQPGQHALMSRMVEKPPRDEAPSNLAVVGRYVLPARVFELLENTQPGAGGEIQLTDAIAELMKSEGVEAWHITDRSHDCGSKLGYLEATVAYGLQHPTLGADFRAMLGRYQG